MDGNRPSSSPLQSRSAAEVLQDHLDLRCCGAVEEDLARNYAADVVVLTTEGAFHGHDGVRQLAQKLERELPKSRFIYKIQLADDRMAFLEWTCESDNGACVEDGADSFLIENGKIRAKTIHYTVRHR